MNENSFNIRVYGILVNERQELLVMDELIRGLEFTKFPGGGLEWGEGTHACLIREFQEELRQPIEVVEHFYTTDYFQASAFNERHQLLSIYYRVKLAGEQLFETKLTPYDFSSSAGSQAEVARWIPVRELSPGMFKWPVDKVVAEMLLRNAGR